MKKRQMTFVTLTLIVTFCSAFTYMYATQVEKQETEEIVRTGATQQVTQRAVTQKKKKVLVAYFSVPEKDGVDASSGASRIIADGKLMGNTQYVASIIAQTTGGDLFEIKTVHTYPDSHKALIETAKEEADSHRRPKLATHIKNIKDYDVVFVGFPNWWSDMPMPLYTFFEEYDFSGKTIIPFCTHGGSRFSDVINTIRGLEKKATVLNGHAISREHIESSDDGIKKWIKKIGLEK